MSQMAVALDHDEDAERVAAALGGELPACMTIVRAFADPTAVTFPNDPRLVAYCADPRFVSGPGMAQVAMQIDVGCRTKREQERSRLQRMLLDAEPALRMQWLVRWLDVVDDMPADNVFRASAEFVAYRIAGATGHAQPLLGLQQVVLHAWQRGRGGLPDWTPMAA